MTRRQCELAGYTQTDLRRMTRVHGPWTIVRAGVYMVREEWLGLDGLGRRASADRAAHLTMVTDHVMSHDSAARALGVAMLRPRVDLSHITREGVGGSRTEDGVKHHLTRCELGDVIDVHGMPVTNPARTALDLAREHGLTMGVCAIDQVLARGTTRRQLDRELEVMKSWPHVRTVRRAVDLGDGRAESLAESLGRLLLVEMGFEDIDVQWPVVAGTNVYWTDLRIGCHIVEVDGLQKYLRPVDGGIATASPRQVLRDERRRQAAICAEGLGMSRLGWDDFFGGARRDAMRRVAAEHAVTVARFGPTLPASLIEQAARIRRLAPRRRSAWQGRLWSLASYDGAWRNSCGEAARPWGAQAVFTSSNSALHGPRPATGGEWEGGSMSSLGNDLMAGPPPTHLPVDPAATDLDAGVPPADVVRRHPESPLAWATLAEAALADQAVDDVTAYAYARVGYHRSLDLLRRNGWKGHGPVPWSHEPNRGFLRALAALTTAAGRIGETPEQQRCADFLRDSSPEAADALL